MGMTTAIAALSRSAIPALDREEELDLLAYARAGSTEAREALIRSQIPLVISLSKAAAYSEDSVQAGMIALMDCVDRFDGRGRLSTWAHSRIYGAVIDQIHRDRKGIQDGEEQTETAEDADPGPTPAEQAEAADTAAEIARALEALPPRTAAMLRARYGIGGAEPKTCEQVAAAWGVSKQYASQEIRAGLRSLRFSLKP
jgi:RNA polymerase sigma factor (sigma-70 family)